MVALQRVLVRVRVRVCVGSRQPTMKLIFSDDNFAAIKLIDSFACSVESLGVPSEKRHK